ncbi:restriction endonuclease subunit S [Spirosoma luteum]|uniref:restriction endonuclease subunit S n=1 Tax=Spirosoma luteum TaxID=431553 RepID=UPI000372A669|nr:restriction endonuclease subunit S [Spirosoma luteum]
MSAFEIDSELKSIFLVKRSQVEGRLDPNFYNSNLKKFINARHSIRKISEVVLSFKTGFGVGRQDQEKGTSGIIQVRPTNIDANGFMRFDRNVLIPLELINNQNLLLETDDVLFNNTNSQDLVGKTALHKFVGQYSFSNHITVIKVDKRQIKPEYLWILLNIYQRNLIFYAICTNWNNQSGVSLDVIKSLKIPVPEMGIQQKIAELFEKSLKQKVQKETQAVEQIARIDDYLLSELGIRIPERDDALENRIFTVNFSESSGKRFDPLFFYHNFLDQLPMGRYPVEPLSKHVAYFQSGFAAGKGDQVTDLTEQLDEAVIQLRPTNLNDDRELVFDRNVYIHANALAKRHSDILQPGEVLFNNTNSQELVGKSVLFDLEGDYFCSNHMTRIGTANSLHPDFLAHLLNLYQRQSVFFRICTNWNNQSGVNTGVLSGVPIPIPPIEQQKKIAQTITDLRSSAKKLRQEAKDELEQARKEVERMILEE